MPRRVYVIKDRCTAKKIDIQITSMDEGRATTASWGTTPTQTFDAPDEVIAWLTQALSQLKP